MTINPQEQIGGVRLVCVRNFLRRWKRDMWSFEALQDHMELRSEDARSLLNALIREGYVEQESELGQVWYSVTSRGLRLAAASAARPISRRTADQKLAEFLCRVEQVNATKQFAFTVEKVVMFGSYLSNAQKLGDIDLAVKLRPRHEDDVLQERLEYERRNATQRRFGNYTEELGWTETEVIMFLKSRSRTIQLVRFAALQSPNLKDCAQKIIFEQH